MGAITRIALFDRSDPHSLRREGLGIETPMGEMLGVLAAMASSALGGAAVGATRYVASVIDPLALGALRFGVGFALLCPLAALQNARWPSGADRSTTGLLGLLFFAVFPVLFNASLHFTTATRGALALSTLPLLTMAVGAMFGAETMTRRKTIGVLVAVAGVGLALISGLADAPTGAWKGDLLMVAAALCMALYTVWSRPVIGRSGPLTFTAAAMGVGALILTVVSVWRGGFAPVAQFGAHQWLAIGYLGIFGGAVVFYLWAFALSRASPTRVAIAVTVNPIAAAFVGWVALNESMGWNLVVGLVTVFAGIWLATTRAGPTSPRPGRNGAT